MKRLTRLCFVCTLSISSTAHAAALRTVSLTGQPAPGTAAGVTFETFGSFIHPVSFVYGGAVLNDAGHVAFRANLTGDGVDFSNHQGVWSEGSGSLALVARTPSDDRGPWVYVTNIQGLNPGRLAALYRQCWRVEQVIDELVNGHDLNHLVSPRLHPNRVAVGFPPDAFLEVTR